MSTTLIVPLLDRLSAYVDALERGWSPDNILGDAARVAILERIRADAALFIERQTNLEALGGPVELPDGTKGERLPSRAFWIFDADQAFCGSINLRWPQHGRPLPPHVLGHVGYAVVPWQRRRCHASAALRSLLPYARALGLPWIWISTDPHNIGSRKVIESAGGVLIESFTRPGAYGHSAAVRYRVDLA
jgi:predicted acetyltransferase